MKLPRRARLAAGARFLIGPTPVPTTVEPAAGRPSSGVDFPTDWARRGPARMVRKALHEALMGPAIRAVARPDVRGLDRLGALREDEPVIFAANHHSHTDTPLLLRTIPRPWRDELFVGAAADYFFPNRLTGAASALALNAIPIERSKVTRRSADDAARLLEHGWSMLIYPEGGRSPDGWAQPFRGGAAYLALRCRAPVVPIHVGGTDRILPKGKRWPSPGRATVTFGPPLAAAPGEDSRRLAARVEAAVAALADEVATDWYSARLRHHAGTTPSLTGPETVAWRRAWSRSARAGDEPPGRRWP
ncbi:MAG: 1-acyl-sn-glycerol-3-phosphate acyltransferase, partial [Acidimicrobiia bacterium]|nr:1-acyl-sn-glycerol-3-phosphate acyltransferase [Acidimicrobiia bacterium]